MKYLITIPILVTSLSTNAEVITDGTLGQNINLPGPEFQITSDLGQQHGGNLFHSFQDFNLNSLESATFYGPDSVQNILSRVTGGNPSNIDGLIRSTIPNADMYFLNPYGIMFGPNAKLDVQGSFHASTADYLRLGENGRFDVRNLRDSLLTVAPVESFGFLTDSPAPLSVNGSKRIVVPVGKTLSLIGGDIEINKSKMMAPSGRINIASVADGQNKISVTSPTPKQAGNVTVRSSVVTVSDGSGSGGIISIRAGKLLVTNSVISANTRNANDGGNINVQADELIANKTGRFMTSAIASGNGGNITIKVKM
ncbi:filamentous hemagglutinin N-terminal domain-containing protein [Candidatus Halobeggiatoa sp. HSG11]|nr:filamentous hemagglutinin N-terminal domain-containing protein [Candidatus Halobeggiatoa sp. HSG11]